VTYASSMAGTRTVITTARFRAQRVRPSALSSDSPSVIQQETVITWPLMYALNPRIIIADEATSALDVSLRAQTLDLLLELQEHLSLTFLFITHDISTVHYCDRVAVMHQGRVVEMGTVDQVLEASDHPYTRKLMSAVPRIHPA
jgi:ABC-type oligopeptide transport system ATPase subunit